MTILVALVLLAGGYVLWSQEAVIAGIEPPPRSSFDPALIAKGAQLGAIGNCAVCHTAAGGRAYAGGRAIPTPLGSIYSTNITPAAGTGIGRWPEAAFDRAMRRGVSRHGAHLYPAFPYDHFAKLSDDDLHALYAFLMTRLPVEARIPANRLPFPLDQRWLLPFWNALFLDDERFRPDPSHDAEWNRGAYLISGLGHCGDCHTPRNLLAAEKPSQALAGGDAEGWRAPALNAASYAPLRWTEAQLMAYLREGEASEHGAAIGPMREVTDGLAQADEPDIRAIAIYLADLQAKATSAQEHQVADAKTRTDRNELSGPARGQEPGAVLFAGACAACHAGGRRMVPPHGIDLARSTAIAEADPRNAIRIVLGGIQPKDNEPGPLMPGFAGAFTDDQLTRLLDYIRAQDGKAPPWPDLKAKLHDIRSSASQ